MQLILKKKKILTSLHILFSSYYENALNSCPEGVEFPQDALSTAKLLKRSLKVERPSVPKPYSLTDDLVPVEVHKQNSRDISEMNWGMGKHDKRVRLVVC